MPLNALGNALSSDTQKDALASLCSADMDAIEALLWKGVRSSSALPQDLSKCLIECGGKRIRPYLLVLTYHSFRAANGSAHRVAGHDLHTLAAVAEWVHTATLFHDDVIDNSNTRRDKPAAHVLHGNKNAILVGDFVYAEAFALLMERGHLEPSRELAATIKTVVEGELLQHKVAEERSLRFDDYQHIARAKTGALFGWCTGTGCWAAGSSSHAMAREFGTLLGQAFQMADDLFDAFSIEPATADADALGEWIESSPPLPLVLAGEKNPRVAELWDALKNFELRQQRESVTELLEICRDKHTVAQGLALIQKVLAKAESLRVELGDNPTLKTALDLIQARAHQGVQFAENFAGSRARA